MAILPVALYLATTSMRPALERHMTDGSLQWLGAVPGIQTTIQLYCAPASWLARWAPLRQTLEFMSDGWCELLAAPETT
jgi:hypothetical protein